MSGSNLPVSVLLNSKGRELFSIEPSATVYQAIERMAEKGVGCLIVLDQGNLAGIISERDYTRKVILAGRASRDTRVDEIMTANVATVSSEDSVNDCMRLMTQKRIRHLPVVENGRVAGMLSIGDLVKHIIADQEETIQQLNSYIVGAYPS
jgi:CBS domain-containing protein